MKPIETDNIVITSAYTGPFKTRTYKINGKKVTDHHYGVDLIGGTKILATADGKVIQVVNSGSKGGVMCLIRIQHKKYQSAYYHIKSGSALVRVGDYVRKGQHIAEIGNTGKVSGKHLHFQLDKGTNKSSIDPTYYAKGIKELDGLTIPDEKWEKGKDYILLYPKYLRSSPKVAVNKVKYAVLSDNAQKKCTKDKQGYAKYIVGKKIKIKDFTIDSLGNVWGRTNTLYVCVEDSSGDQVKKA